ncbi:MAG: T9SS C-terminal target domain-containing protein [Bacteroidota bacterium]
MPAIFRKCYIILLLILSSASYAQIGNAFVTAPLPPVKTVNNKAGSCTKTRHCKPRLATRLPETLKETSGLVFFNGQLWTINDSGNPPAIYQVDTTTGFVLRTVMVSNAVNTDWESITQHDSNIFIGDFGNNYGNRTDLRILKISKAKLLNPEIHSLEAGYIRFAYADQSSFSQELNSNNFDCEAFVYCNDSLHLLSKDWTDLQTRHYVLPADTGNFIAKYVGQFNANGLITDAAISKNGNIVLLGYKKMCWKFYSCFAWLLSDYQGGEFFSGNRSRIKLGSAFHLGQTEGVALKKNGQLWISAESILSGILYHPTKLFRLTLKGCF